MCQLFQDNTKNSVMKLKFFILFFIPLLFSSQNSSFIYELNFKPNSDSTKTEKTVGHRGRKRTI